MRNALPAFTGMLAAVLASLWIFHAVADCPTSLEHATVEADRAAVFMREDSAPGASRLKIAVAGNWLSSFEFDARSGQGGGRVRLVPDLAATQAMGVQWRCETADFPLIGRALPACTYVPGSSASTGTPEVAG